MTAAATRTTTIISIVLLTFSIPAYAAWEWQDRSALEWGIRLPFYPEPCFSDSSGWSATATITHPYGLTDLTEGHLRGAIHANNWYMRGELSQLGADGYRETSLRMYRGHKLGRLLLLGGFRLGVVNVVPLVTRYREALGVDAEWQERFYTLSARGELPLQHGDDPVALPQKISAVAMVNPVKTISIGLGYDRTNNTTSFGVGGEWTPLRELTLRLGVDPQHGWGGGVTIRYRQFAFSFASFSVEQLGWSSLWTVQAGPEPREQPGYRYPVTRP